jgi:hypothetical protein
MGPALSAADVVKNVAKGSTTFNKLILYVVESKDSPKGSAPAPKADSGVPAKLRVFNGFCFNEMRVAY